MTGSIAIIGWDIISEVEFVYLHGTHHDAIPCALIGVGENGHLEGVFRQIIGFPSYLL